MSIKKTLSARLGAVLGDCAALKLFPRSTFAELIRLIGDAQEIEEEIHRLRAQVAAKSPKRGAR
jgi:hypothetical protein